MSRQPLLFAIVVAAVLVLFIAACNGDDDADDNTAAPRGRPRPRRVTETPRRAQASFRRSS